MSTETDPPPGGPTVLLVEDDDGTRVELARNLRAHGYQIVEAATASAALRAWEARRPDVVLLDLGLPDRDGLSVARRMRREAAIPIVVLSARGDEAVKVQALELGADDYVTKPFSMPELHARIRAVLRRAGGPQAAPDGILRNGSLAVDPVGHEVRVNGQPVTLVPREFQILAELVAHSGRLVTRGRLLRAVWGEAYTREDHYIHVYVSQIRRKLAAADPDGELDDLLVAEPGVGYRVRPATAET
jgi:two-component system KDP operon response regulator KdpE